MSDTPISDSTPHKVAELGMLCRRLERQLNAFNDEIERLTAKAAQLYEGAEEQNDRIKRLEEELMDTKNKHAVLVADVVLNEDRAERIKRLEEENNELRAEEARLLNTNGELERRIKRLIDAGDAMFPWSERVGQEFWNKAKEAKL